VSIQTKPQQNRNEAWLDWLRVIATVMVVILHCTSLPLNNYGVTDNFNWLVSLVLRNIVAVSVPLFFMMSGYLYLIKPEINIAHFLRRRIAKIVVPFLVWSCFLVGYTKGFQVANIGFADVLLPLKEPVMYHLWFMYPLLGLYLALPLIHNFVRNVPESIIKYALAYWLICNGVSRYLFSFAGFSFAVPAQFITELVGYFIAGYFIISYNFKPKKVIALVVVTVLIMVIGTYVLSIAEQRSDWRMYDIKSAHIMILVMALFWLAHHYRSHFKQSRLISMLSDRSYMVYLVHPIFLHKAETVLFGDIAHLSAFYTPVIVSITVFCSYGLAFLSRMLGLKRIIG